MSRNVKDPSQKGRTTPFTDEDRATLRRLVVANPRATRARLCGMFARLSGRTISIASADRLLARIRRSSVAAVPPLPPAELPPSAPARTFNGRAASLTRAQRQELVGVLRRHPDATNGQVMAIFVRLTGRAISHNAVKFARDNLDTYGDPRSGRDWLTDEERKILLDVVRESHPEYCAKAIASQFSAIVGRPYSDTCVGQFMADRLGLPRPGRGKNCRHGRDASVEAAIAEASRLKLESAPVDRSVRPGRTSRHTG